MKKEVLLPKLGESLVSAKIVRWLKNIGDSVSKDEPIVEVMTDKVASEIPSPFEGKLDEKLVAIDDEVGIGKPLCTILPQEQQQHSPSVKKLLAQHGLQSSDISRSQSGNRLSRKDIEAHLSQKSDTHNRSALVNNLVRAHQTIPQGTLSTRIDITKLYQWRLENKEAFFEEHQTPLTMTVLFIHALSKALQRYPLIYSVWEENTILTPSKIDIGLAIDREKGADIETICEEQLSSVPFIAHEIALIKKEARPKKSPKVTLTNIGMSGIEQGFPLVPLFQTSIIAIGAPTEEWRPNKEGFSVRKLAWFSLAFDHRVFDGMYGCQFLQELKNLLEHYESTM